MRPVCAFTGRSADHWHHVTGRGVDGLYLDDLVFPLARRQHVLEHQAWRRVGLDDATQLPPSVLRLRRAAHLWVRLGAHHGFDLVTLPAPSVLAHGVMMNEVADELAGEA